MSDNDNAQQLKDQMSSWALSLSDKDLHPLMRQKIKEESDLAGNRYQHILTKLEQLAGYQESISNLLDLNAAVDRLKHLDRVLAKGNPSDINVTLAMHVQAFVVYPDGKVLMKTNRLGVFEGVTQLLCGNGEIEQIPASIDGKADDANHIKPRALSRRRTTLCINDSVTSDSGLIVGPVDLPDKWVDEAIFKMPQLKSWSEEHALEVLAYKQDHPKLSQNKIAKHFGVSPPTIRKAIQIAENGIGRKSRPVRKWTEPKFKHHSEVSAAAWRMHDEEHLPVKKIAKRLGVNRNTVARALDAEYAKRGMQRPDGRSRQGRTKRKLSEPPLYQQIAAKAVELMNDGALLGEIAEVLRVDRNTVTKAFRWWHEQRGLPVPDGRTRRKQLSHKTRK